MGIKLNENEPLIHTNDSLVNIYHATDYNCSNECSNNSCCEGEGAKVTICTFAMNAALSCVPFGLGMSCSSDDDVVPTIQKFAGGALAYSVAHLAFLCYLRCKPQSYHNVDSRFPTEHEVKSKMIRREKCSYDTSICFTVACVAANITSLVIPLFTCSTNSNMN